MTSTCGYPSSEAPRPPGADEALRMLKNVFGAYRVVQEVVKPGAHVVFLSWRGDLVCGAVVIMRTAIGKPPAGAPAPPRALDAPRREAPHYFIAVRFLTTPLGYRVSGGATVGLSGFERVGDHASQSTSGPDSGQGHLTVYAAQPCPTRRWCCTASLLALY